MSARRRHRHLLVLPCCILAALVPVVGLRFQPLTTAAITAMRTWVGADALQAFALVEEGSWAFLTPGTRLTSAEGTYAMETGSVTFRTRAPLRIQAAGWTVLAWHGAGHVTVGTRITVAALHAPLLLQKDGRRFVVAPGTSVSLPLSSALPGSEQAWCDRVTSLRSNALPQSFVMEQEALLRTLPSDDTSRTPEDIAWLSLAGDGDVDLWMLLSLHPDAAGMAWIVDPPQRATPDDVLLRMALLPFIDRAPTPLTPLVLSRFADQFHARALLHGEGERLAFLLARLEQGASALHTLGFPERAGRYGALASELRTDAERFQALPTVTCTSPDGVRQSVDTPPQIPPMDAASTSVLDLAAVRSRLSALGALFARDSSIEAQPDGTLLLRTVLFASGGGYRSFDLLLDAQAETALVISEGSQTYPNAMALERFAAWAKGE